MITSGGIRPVRDRAGQLADDRAAGLVHQAARVRELAQVAAVRALVEHRAAEREGATVGDYPLSPQEVQTNSRWLYPRSLSVVCALGDKPTRDVVRNVERIRADPDRTAIG
jgi:hypothetical protein